MRLSSILSEAVTNRLQEVEPFMGKTRASWGTHRKIEIGTVTRQYLCAVCKSVRPFNSKGQLNCLVAGPDLISVDVVLKCIDCDSSLENWYLVRCADDLFGLAPSVSLIQFSEHLGHAASRPGVHHRQIEDLIDRADIARQHQLGAGSLVYLRKVFEIVTHTAAAGIGLPLETSKGKRRSFAEVLKEVDIKTKIIPKEFAENSYRLFSELSEVVHGDADEDEALKKYESLRRLVLGIVENVRNSDEISQAATDLGLESKSQP